MAQSQLTGMQLMVLKSLGVDPADLLRLVQRLEHSLDLIEQIPDIVANVRHLSETLGIAGRDRKNSVAVASIDPTELAGPRRIAVNGDTA